MKKATAVKVLMALAASALLISCASPLEDVEITDFGLIRATFNVYSDIDKKVTGSPSQLKTIEAIFEDKNYHNMQLKGASVMVNGVPMSYDDNALVRRYKSSLALKANTDYTFVVTLVNGDTAVSVLTTDEIDFGGLSYNTQLTKGVDYTVTWGTKGSTMQSEFWSYDTPDFSSLHELSNTTAADQGTTTLTAAQSSNHPSDTQVAFKLTREGTETVSGKFKSATGAVYSTYFVEGIPIQ